MNSLTSIERIVLESISAESKSFKEILIATDLSPRLVLNILNALTLRGILTQSNGCFQANDHIPKEAQRVINGPDSHKSEAMEMIESLLEANENCLRLKKAFISDRDKTILSGMFKGIEDFIKTLPHAPKGTPISEYSLIVWGQDIYGQNIKRMLGEI